MTTVTEDLATVRGFIDKAIAFDQEQEVAHAATQRLQEAGYAGAEVALSSVEDCAPANNYSRGVDGALADVRAMLEAGGNAMEFLYRSQILHGGQSLAATAADLTHHHYSQEDLDLGEQLRKFATGRADLPEWAEAPATAQEDAELHYCQVRIDVDAAVQELKEAFEASFPETSQTA